MQRLKKHAELGLRWIRCGWRLFSRNPWLLGAMGFCCSVVATAMVQVPLVGYPFLGLLAPTAVASFYITIDAISKQKTKLPAALRWAAIRQSPREFRNIARQERRLMQVLVMGLYSLVTVVVTDILIWLLAGAVLASPLSGLSFGALIIAAIATLLRFSLYLLLAASLVFTLPLALLQDQALVPAVIDSTRRSLHYGVALLVVGASLFVPLFLGAIASFYSTGLGYGIGILTGTIALPVSVCSLYCSYRTVFTFAEPAHQMHAHLRGANVG